MCSAVEELIALGASVEVTLSQQRMGAWAPDDAPCKLSEHVAKPLWKLKMGKYVRLQFGPAASVDSIFRLIHLAVRLKNTHDHPRFQTA